MDIIDVRGTVDIHIHSAPCLYDRVGDDWEIAKACRAAGMRAIVLGLGRPQIRKMTVENPARLLGIRLD